MLVEIDRFVNWVRRRSPQARTWRDYGYDLAQFAAFLGDIPPHQVTVQQVDGFVNQQVNRGLKASTVNRRLATIVSFYSFLADDNPELLCPVRPRRHLLKERTLLPRPLPAPEISRFFAAIHDPRDYAIFLLMLRGGLRIGEVTALRLADLFLDEVRPRLLVRGKGSRERAIYLSAQAEEALRRYLAQRPQATSDFLFLSYLGDGLSTTAIHKRLMRYRTQAGLTLTAHQLRHTFANDLLCADVPVTTIQKLLGHRWLESTQSYVAANDTQVRDDFYAVSARMEGWS